MVEVRYHRQAPVNVGRYFDADEPSPPSISGDTLMQMCLLLGPRGIKGELERLTSIQHPPKPLFYNITSTFLQSITMDSFDITPAAAIAKDSENQVDYDHGSGGGGPGCVVV